MARAHVSLSDTLVGDRRVVAIISGAPIAAMSALFLAPLLVFWLRVFGPLRPFDVSPVPSPPALAFSGAALVCLLAAYVPASYFRVRASAAGERWYRAVGVRQFRKVVPDGDWMNRVRRRQDRRFRLIRSRADAAAWAARTEASERGHLVLLLAGVFSAGYAVHVGWTAWAIILTAGNVITNLYPVLLQRYTRARLARVVADASD